MLRFRAVAMLLAVAAALALGLTYSRERGGKPIAALPALAGPAAADRVLVVAPHCDDETLGPGGMLAAAARSAAAVRVVLVTSGDGFHYGAERLFRERQVSPLDYVRMGLDRQRETIAALGELGVARRDVAFLGYPDGGTDELWTAYWDPQHPYTSPDALDNHSPYPDALTPFAPYAGRSALDDLKKILAEFRPTVIFCPHPNDEHRDHWAAYCYTAAALYELGMLESVKVRLYLVHRGDWPRPRGLHRHLPLLPPGELAKLNARWVAFPLDAAAERAEYRAVLRYRSQLLVMRSFLFSFIRTNELFGEMPWGRLRRVSSGVITQGGDSREWDRLGPAILDPPEAHRIGPAADLLRVYAAAQGGRLLVRVELAGAPARDVEYRLYLHPLAAGRVGPPETFVFRTGEGEGNAVFLRNGFEASLLLSPAGLMLAAETTRNGRKLDQTAWALLRGEAAR
ncbi:MAG: PIG-L deacetylase family protein [Armatimonadota bacterium]